ncbi:MAG: VanW family protein [Acetivibrionales bacterium]|jgi:vancomycin resistance protein YoaR
MNGEVHKSPLKQKPLSILIITIGVFSLLMLGIAGQLTYSVLKYDRVYNGIYINNIHVGKLSLNEMDDLLKSSFGNNLQSQKITLNAGKAVREFTLEELEAAYNLEKAVEEAYSIGRSGNLFNRLYSIISAGRKGMNINITVDYNREKLDSIVNSLYDEIFVNVKEADVLIEEEKVTIRSGHSGISIDKDEVTAAVESLIQKEEGGSIDIQVEITKPNKIEIEDIYDQIIKEPQNASVQIENNKVKIIPHITGRHVEKADLISVSNQLELTEDTEMTIPIKTVQPEITDEKLNSILFRDTLGTMNTYFSSSGQNDSNRAENIRLAATTINGLILGPDEVFSFNGVLGPRTAEKGYKEAHAYIGGEVIDDIGGGICQVSSTLYNAVLYAGLQVVERSNHMFTVGYVPLGLDAAVSYGGPDLKFKNSTPWPIKIEASIINNNRVSFTIKGTSENPKKQFEFISKLVNTIDFPTKFIDDPNIPEGQTKIKQNGKKGYVADTYRIVKEDGKVIEEVKLHTSTYNPLTEEILRGTKKIENIPPEQQEKIPGEEIKSDTEEPEVTEEPEGPEEIKTDTGEGARNDNDVNTGADMGEDVRPDTGIDPGEETQVDNVMDSGQYPDI